MKPKSNEASISRTTAKKTLYVIALIVVLGCALCFLLPGVILLFTISGDEPQFITTTLRPTAEYLIAFPGETPDYILEISPSIGQSLVQGQEICVNIDASQTLLPSIFAYQIRVNERRIDHQFIKRLSERTLRAKIVVQGFCFNLPLNEPLSLIEFRRSPFDEKGYIWAVKTDN